MCNMRLNGAKCSFGKAETEFLGFLVNEHGYTLFFEDAILLMESTQTALDPTPLSAFRQI